MEEALRYHGILQRMDKQDKIRLIQSLTRKDAQDNLHVLFELLGDSIYEFRRAAANELKKFGVDILEDLVELFRSGNADQQYWCVQLLVEMGPYALNALEMVLNCDDPTLQQIAVASLAKHKSKSSVRPLMNLLRGGGWGIRQAAFQALKGYGESISEDCQEALHSDNEDLVYWAVRLLGGMSYRYKKPLFKMLQDTGPEMKFVVASALGEAGDTKVLGMLVKCFKENSWIHSKRACDALVQVGSKAIPVIMDELRKEHFSKIHWYAKTLLRMGDNGIDSLTQFLGSKGESYLWNCRDHLVQLENDLVPLIRQLILSENRKIRFFAYQLAADLRHQSCLELLIHGLSDEVWTCKKLCADALVQIGDSVIPALKPLIASSKYDDMHWLIQILKRLGGGQKLLIDCLRRDAKDIITEAARALRDSNLQDSVLPLLTCLKHPEWLVRKESSETLISLGSLGLEHLIKSLATEEEELQFWLSYILKRYPRSVYPYLTTLLYRKDYPAHLAARAMGIMADEYFVMPLREALKSQDSVLVLDASWAISQIYPDEHVKSIWGLLGQLDLLKYPRLENMIFQHREFANEFIEQGINTKDDLLIKNCIHLVGRLSISQMTTQLKEKLSGTNQEHAIMAADAFLHLGDKSVIPYFHKMLEGDLSSELRLKILSVVGTISEEDVIYLILKMIQQSESETDRTRFSTEILRMGIKAIPQLVDALGKEEIPIRKASAELLLEFGALAVPYLKQDEHLDDSNVRFWKSKILKVLNQKN